MPLNPQFTAAREAYRVQRLTETRAKVLAAVTDSHVPLTQSEVASAIGVHADTARKHLTALVESGELARDERLFSPATPVKRTARKTKEYPASPEVVEIAAAAVRQCGTEGATANDVAIMTGYNVGTIRKAFNENPDVFTHVADEQTGTQGRPSKLFVLTNEVLTPAFTPELLEDELGGFTTEELVTELFARLRKVAGL